MLSFTPPSEPPAPPRPSLGEVHGSVLVPSSGPGWRRWLAVAGPALMVSVGYMDPGNWATDIAAGSRYEYRLLWVLLMSNLMAVLLQSLAARVGIVRRRDLAQVCRETYPPPVNFALYLLAEAAIAACDLAEVVGSAIALKLLFGLPLLIGVVITAFDVLLLMALTHFGIRKLEAVIIGLVGMIGGAMLVEVLLAKPSWPAFGRGFSPGLPDSGALVIAIGIIGATVMPHNLYLHSALVQTRRFAGGATETRRAIRLNIADSALALNLAFFINAAILVMAAAVFFRTGQHQVVEIEQAHELLEPILGASVAPIAFAVALLAAGQSSTVTGTLAGQIVMEGFLDFRIRPWLRRLVTRLLAVVPAVAVILWFGEGKSAELLVLSQVLLSLQLPFAVVPLVHIASDRRKMGEFAIGRGQQLLAWITAFLIAALNIWLVLQTLGQWLEQAGPLSWLVKLVGIPLAVACAVLFVWVTLGPLVDRRRALRTERKPARIHKEPAMAPIRITPPAPVRKVALCLDFSGQEERLIEDALRFLAPNKPALALFHVVESASAVAFGGEAADSEMTIDRVRLEAFGQALRELGFEVSTALGAGHPVKELARLITEAEVDLAILGGHGHRGLADIIHGTTAEALRHRVKASVLVIPLG